MRFLAGLALSLAAFACVAQEQEIQRALIQRDQQSAEFANRTLENLHARQLLEAGRPLHPDPQIARQLRPYERQRMAQERELVRKSGSDSDFRTARKSGSDPLPLPGGPRHGVDPIPAQGPGY